MGTNSFCPSFDHTLVWRENPYTDAECSPLLYYMLILKRLIFTARPLRARFVVPAAARFCPNSWSVCQSPTAFFGISRVMLVLRNTREGDRHGTNRTTSLPLSDL